MLCGKRLCKARPLTIPTVRIGGAIRPAGGLTRSAPCGESLARARREDTGKEQTKKTRCFEVRVVGDWAGSGKRD
jgi:hypothetical protein